MKIDLTAEWDPTFAPSFTPMEMVERGVFMDSHYSAVIKGLPAAWYKQDNLILPGQEPDPKKNYFGVKSRQSLKVWQENKWTTKDSPLGWWEWYVKYYFGRRLAEDQWQIGRWRSFVARHMGQVKASCKLTDNDCHRAQRQGLLQWAWDSSKPFEDKVLEKNIQRLGVTKFAESEQNSSKW